MAFKRNRERKRTIELVSFMDMIFILLVFFLVTSFVIRTSYQERSLYVPTPKNTLGRAQILIQLIGNDRVFWMDESASDLVSKIEENYGYLSPVHLRNKILSELIKQNSFSFNKLGEKLENLRTRAEKNPSAKFFVLIRSPNDMPYFRIVDIIAKLSNTKYRNINYGCVGGTIAQIKKCKRIYIVAEKDSNGKKRKNIRIDF